MPAVHQLQKRQEQHLSWYVCLAQSAHRSFWSPIQTSRRPPTDGTPDFRYCGAPGNHGILSRYYALPADMAPHIPDSVGWDEAGSIQPLAVSGRASGTILLESADVYSDRGADWEEGGSARPPDGGHLVSVPLVSHLPPLGTHPPACKPRPPR
jgi:hypothetical protein